MQRDRIDTEKESGDILTAPSGIVKIFPLLRNAWHSPVAQRYIQKNKKRHLVEPLIALYIGAGLAVIIGSVIGLSLNPNSFSVYSMYRFIVTIPASIALIYCIGKLAGPVFVRTPLRIKELVDPDKIDPFILTPLTDAEIYVPEALAPILLYHKVIEETVLFFVGLNVGSFLSIMFWALKLGGAGRYHLESNILPWLGFMLIVVVNFVLILIHSALSASLVAMRLPVIIAIPAAIMRVVLAFLLSILPAFFITSGITLMIFEVSIYGEFVFLIVFPVQVIFFYLILKIQVDEGVMEFSKRRRAK